VLFRSFSEVVTPKSVMISKCVTTVTTVTTDLLV
jgi:hypothetical protein